MAPETFTERLTWQPAAHARPLEIDLIALFDEAWEGLDPGA